MNEMKVVRQSDFGIYLRLGDDEVLLPKKFVPTRLNDAVGQEETRIGDKLSVFVYHDSEERLVASMTRPSCIVGEFAFLKVKTVAKVGAFLEWHPEKDLFVPFREQNPRMSEGKYYVVRVCLDEKTNRVMGSGNFNRFLSENLSNLKEGQKVDIIVYRTTPLGFQVVADNTFSGLIYADEVFEPLKVGDRKSIYIKKIREDGKIDLSLRQQGFSSIQDAKTLIMDVIRKSNGFLPLSDASRAEEIYVVFGISKKLFKKAIGGLFKEGKICISERGITEIVGIGHQKATFRKKRK